MRCGAAAVYSAPLGPAVAAALPGMWEATRLSRIRPIAAAAAAGADDGREELEQYEQQQQPTGTV